jgi:hypothetical protein
VHGPERWVTISSREPTMIAGMISPGPSVRAMLRAVRGAEVGGMGTSSASSRSWAARTPSTSSPVVCSAPPRRTRGCPV